MNMEISRYNTVMGGKNMQGKNRCETIAKLWRGKFPWYKLIVKEDPFVGFYVFVRKYWDISKNSRISL